MRRTDGTVPVEFVICVAAPVVAIRSGVAGGVRDGLGFVVDLRKHHNTLRGVKIR